MPKPKEKTPILALSARFLDEVRQEVSRARQKFPSNRRLLGAFHEETGELTKALLHYTVPEDRYEDETRDSLRLAVWKEAIQSAAMAMRLAVEGDPDYHPPGWRKRLKNPSDNATATLLILGPNQDRESLLVDAALTEVSGALDLLGSKLGVGGFHSQACTDRALFLIGEATSVLQSVRIMSPDKETAAEALDALVADRDTLDARVAEATKQIGSLRSKMYDMAVERDIERLDFKGKAVRALEDAGALNAQLAEINEALRITGISTDEGIPGAVQDVINHAAGLEELRELRAACAFLYGDDPNHDEPEVGLPAVPTATIAADLRKLDEPLAELRRALCCTGEPHEVLQRAVKLLPRPGEADNLRPFFSAWEDRQAMQELISAVNLSGGPHKLATVLRVAAERLRPESTNTDGRIELAECTCNTVDPDPASCPAHGIPL